MVQALLDRGSDGPLGATDELVNKFESVLAQNLTAENRGALLISLALMKQGRHDTDDLVALADEAVDLLATAGGDSKFYNEALAVSAGFNVEAGNLASALNHCLRLAQCTSLTPRVKHNFASTLARLGAFAASSKLFAEVVAEVRNKQNPLFTVVAAMNLLISLSRLELLTEGLLLSDDHQEDLDLIDQALRPIVDGNGSSSVPQLARLVLAQVPLARGDMIAARDLWGTADATIAHPDEAFRARLVLVEGYLALDDGDLDRVDELLAFCAQHPAGGKALPLGRVEIALLHVGLHRARGEVEDAFARHRAATAHALQDRVDLPMVLMEEMRSRVELEREQALLLDHTTRLTEESLRDVLSGIPNRRALDLRLAKMRAQGQASAGVILLDIDRFKAINDTYGHLVGDQVIAAVGNLLQTACRKADFIARFGGEEFVIIPATAIATDALALAERVRGAFVTWPWGEEGVNGQVTASFGVAVGFGADVDLLLSRADQALYQAKNAGRNMVVLSRD